MTALWTASSLMGDNKLFLKEKEEAGPWWLPALCLHPSFLLMHRSKPVATPARNVTKPLEVCAILP